MLHSAIVDLFDADMVPVLSGLMEQIVHSLQEI